MKHGSPIRWNFQHSNVRYLLEIGISKYGHLEKFQSLIMVALLSGW